MMGQPPAPTLRRMASLISLAVAFVLIGIKFWAWIATGSVAMLTSAIDALVDAAAALATFVGVRYAQRPLDPQHRWGYGKAEAIATYNACDASRRGSAGAHRPVRWGAKPA